MHCHTGLCFTYLFGNVFAAPCFDFPLTVRYPWPVELVRLLDPVDPDQPPGRRVGLLQVREAEVFVSNHHVTGVVVTGGRVVAHLQLAKAVVAQLVHETIQKGLGSLTAKTKQKSSYIETLLSKIYGRLYFEREQRGGFTRKVSEGHFLPIDSELSTFCEVVCFADVVGVLALCDSYHPQKLVDVVAAVADDPAEDDEDVVHVQLRHDLVGRRLIGGHGLAHQGDVRVVPRVVVYQRRSVRHSRNLTKKHRKIKLSVK